MNNKRKVNGVNYSGSSTSKKEIKDTSKNNSKLIDSRKLERNILTEISRELTDKQDKRNK